MLLNNHILKTKNGKHTHVTPEKGCPTLTQINLFFILPTPPLPPSWHRSAGIQPLTTHLETICYNWRILFSSYRQTAKPSVIVLNIFPESVFCFSLSMFKYGTKYFGWNGMMQTKWKDLHELFLLHSRTKLLLIITVRTRFEPIVANINIPHLWTHILYTIVSGRFNLGSETCWAVESNATFRFTYWILINFVLIFNWISTRFPFGFHAGNL